MPYKGFDIDKNEQIADAIQGYLDYKADDIYDILDEVKNKVSDKDYQGFIEMVKENL